MHVVDLLGSYNPYLNGELTLLLPFYQANY